jgi:hypothetical protein
LGLLQLNLNLLKVVREIGEWVTLLSIKFTFVTVYCDLSYCTLEQPFASVIVKVTLKGAEPQPKEVNI